MRIGMLAVAGVVGLVGCGSSSPKSSSAPPQNIFTGTLTITSALPAGTTTCAATQTVTFTATGANVHTASAAGGDCIAFLNNDTANHQPASNGASCPELDAPGPLTTGSSFTSHPLSGPKTCYWEDSLTPPGGGGGGAGY